MGGVGVRGSEQNGGRLQTEDNDRVEKGVRKKSWEEEECYKLKHLW